MHSPRCSQRLRQAPGQRRPTAAIRTKTRSAPPLRAGSPPPAPSRAKTWPAPSRRPAALRRPRQGPPRARETALRTARRSPSAASSLHVCHRLRAHISRQASPRTRAA
ncbi:hypothetical protein ACFPRL_08565 [Pseudoclavibacter helvolus]